MTLTQERTEAPVQPRRPTRALLAFAAGVVLVGLIAAGVALFLANRSTAGHGKPETLIFQSDGSPSVGGPVAVPDCAALVGQRITAVAVAVGCTINGSEVNIPWSTCSDQAHWYAIPDGANVVYGKGGGSWKMDDQATYLKAAARDC